MPRPRGFSSELGMSFQRPPYRYAFVPYLWVTQNGRSSWRLPASVGGVDLRPLPAQAIAGGSPQGFGFCAALQSPGGTVIGTGLHLSDMTATTAMRDAWETTMGYRPTTGTKLVDLLWDQLTTGADPTGQDGPKPLLPDNLNQLKLVLGGHSVVKQESFRWGHHPHTNRVQATYQHDFERQWEESNGADHCRRVLDFWCKQHREGDWREFVPPRLRTHVPGRLPHATTITESFNTADSTTLGPDLSWTEVSGGWEIVSNRAAKTSTAINRDGARADSDLSSDNHYAQALVYYPTTGVYVGPACRFSSSALTFYQTHSATGGDLNLYLTKVVAGTGTDIASASHTASGGSLSKVQANGSTITAYYGGAEITSATDSAITGNTRGGITQNTHNAGGTFDSFEAADLAVAGHPALRRLGLVSGCRPVEMGRESVLVF